METGIAFQGFVPIRKEPSETSEMVSQVLFGEQFRILESNGQWLLISLDFDSSEGWVIKYGIHQIGSSEKAENLTEGGYRMVSHPIITILDPKQGQQHILPAGSIWPGTNARNATLYGRGFEILSEAGLILPGPGVDPEEIGKGLISLPSIRGGRSGFGFDGPGFTQMLCRMMGKALPRQCNQQAELGATVNFIHEIRKGDMAFFDDATGEINHGGIILDNGRILHCYDQVRIDKLDQHGIFNIEKEAYTHKLRIIKRLAG
jgi:hypothetical protein